MRRGRLALLLCLLILISTGAHAQEDLIGDLIQKESPQLKRHQDKGLVIVIDPGHGGKDAGATGHRGVREKDIVLQISKKH